MKKTKAYLLKDEKTGHYWMHEFSLDSAYYVKTIEGTLDLTKCKPVKAEVVNAVNYGFCMASCDLTVLKDSNKNYMVMAPYLDSMGYGAIYRSINRGFTFKSVHGFNINWENYLVAENLDGKWGIIRIAHNRCEWTVSWNIPFCWPLEIVEFKFEKMSDALTASGLSIPLWKYLNLCEFSRGEGDLVRVKDEANFLGDYDIGTPLADMINSRNNLKCHNLPHELDELYSLLNKEFSNRIDSIKRSRCLWQKDFFDERTKIMTKWLYDDSAISHMAQVLGVSDSFIIGDNEMFAAYILDRYKKYLLRIQQSYPQLQSAQPNQPAGSAAVKRSKSVSFKVTFPDGTVYNNSKAVKTFLDSLVKIGLDKVQQVGILHAGYNLVSDIARPRVGVSTWQTPANGKFVYTKLSKDAKIADLIKISNYYNLNMKIEIV